MGPRPPLLKGNNNYINKLYLHMVLKVFSQDEVFRTTLSFDSWIRPWGTCIGILINSRLSWLFLIGCVIPGHKERWKMVQGDVQRDAFNCWRLVGNCCEKQQLIYWCTLYWTNLWFELFEIIIKLFILTIKISLLKFSFQNKIFLFLICPKPTRHRSHSLS
jgi:hypothetical protein